MGVVGAVHVVLVDGEANGLKGSREGDTTAGWLARRAGLF
jgi:hypothetical protein